MCNYINGKWNETMLLSDKHDVVAGTQANTAKHLNTYSCEKCCEKL